ncbi:MAG: hypothetical protein AMS19_11775 [Gemmatimonas sp. SG8_23]|nr:MAG: hypothetical protein AMS19_11775 [Gemmatimonas sp. SG8_23]
MEASHDERRGAPRYELDLVVTLDGHPAETLNLSSTGLYVLSSRAYPKGAKVAVEILFPALPGGRDRVTGSGRVTRVESEPDGMGLGIRLQNRTFA